MWITYFICSTHSPIFPSSNHPHTQTPSPIRPWAGGWGGGDGWAVAWQAGISGALTLSFISTVLLGPELGFSPSLCLRHVGGGFLTHGSRSHRTMKVLSVRTPSLGRYGCDVTAHEPTHSSQAKSQTRIHQQHRHTELALINTCFHEHVPPWPG